MIAVTVEVSRDYEGVRKRVRLRVEPRVLFSRIPQAILEGLRVPVDDFDWIRVDARHEPRSEGQVFIHYRGRFAPTRAVFATPRDEAILGEHALMGLGLQLNPRTKRLEQRILRMGRLAAGSAEGF